NPGTSDFTIEFWMKSTIVPPIAAYLVSKRTGCGHSSEYEIFIGPAGTVWVALDQNTSGTKFNSFKGPGPARSGTWHHIALTRQGVTARLYIAGSENASGSTAGVTNISNSSKFTVGKNDCPGIYAGEIDELTYYDSAIPASSIAAIYSAGSAGK